MIQNPDGSVSLEKGESVSIDREIGWVVHEWLSDAEYDGALVFHPIGRAAGYTLLPYKEPRPQAG